MLSDVNEPRYRVTLTHNPTDGQGICWTAEVYDVTAGPDAVHVAYGATRERAFDNAQRWIKASLTIPEPPSFVNLNAAGEIIDRHDS